MTANDEDSPKSLILAKNECGRAKPSPLRQSRSLCPANLAVFGCSVHCLAIDDTWGRIDDTWARIDDALLNGYRGLPRGSRLSPARLLAKRRGVRNSEYPPRLSISRIVKWAKQHRRRTRRWPTAESGAIHDAPGETWNAVDLALRKGRRGLRGHCSLARLLSSRCGVRNPQQAPRLTVAKILRWADAFYARHGRRPTRNSGPIAQARGETWMAIHRALQAGRRGLPGGSSLSRLLDEKRPRRRGRKQVSG